MKPSFLPLSSSIASLRRVLGGWFSKPTASLQTLNSLTSQQKSALKQAWSEAYSGRPFARPLISLQAPRSEMFVVNAEEVQHLEARRFQDVLLPVSVHRSVLGPVISSSPNVAFEALRLAAGSHAPSNRDAS